MEGNNETPKVDKPFQDADPLSKGVNFNRGGNGFDLYRGTTAYFSGEEAEDDDATMSLDEAARMEAQARHYAKRNGMQTTVSPDTGVHVSFDDPKSELAQQYSDRVNEHLAALESEE